MNQSPHDAMGRLHVHMHSVHKKPRTPFITAPCPAAETCGDFSQRCVNGEIFFYISTVACLEVLDSSLSHLARNDHVSPKFGQCNSTAALHGVYDLLIARFSAQF